jgi:L-asparaginase II
MISLDAGEAIEVEILREGTVESVHSIACAVADPAGQVLASWGNPELCTFMRSSAKPFQALPAVISGAVDAFRFSEAELALMCASHAGTDDHATVAAKMLAKLKASAEDLQCGFHAPYDPETNLRLTRSGEAPDALRNNCSGKHIGMLAQADFLQAPRSGYLRQEHPVQGRILALLSTMLALPVEEIEVGIDGCSAPNFAVSLRNAAMGYARLMDPTSLAADLGSASRRVVRAMTQHPVLISGDGRFDTELMRLTGGALLSKGGAEGFQCIGIPAGRTGPGQPALGMALKVLDGDLGHRALSLATLHVLHRLGALEASEHKGMAKFDQRPIHNLRGLVVGEMRISPSLQFTARDDGNAQS